MGCLGRLFQLGAEAGGFAGEGSHVDDDRLDGLEAKHTIYIMGIGSGEGGKGSGEVAGQPALFALVPDNYQYVGVGGAAGRSGGLEQNAWACNH